MIRGGRWWFLRIFFSGAMILAWFLSDAAAIAGSSVCLEFGGDAALSTGRGVPRFTKRAPSPRLGARTASSMVCARRGTAAGAIARSAGMLPCPHGADSLPIDTTIDTTYAVLASLVWSGEAGQNPLTLR